MPDHLRSGQEDRATEQVSEVIRSFPDRELSLKVYRPGRLEARAGTNSCSSMAWMNAEGSAQP